VLTSHENFKEFYQSVGAHYPEEDVVYRTLRGRVRKRFVLAHLRNFKGSFIDLGCNRGTYLAHYENGRSLGVDISLPALRVARQRLANTILVQGDAQQLSFLRSEIADCILCSEVIEHVPDARRVVSECYRLLRPGGKLLITTPNYKKQRPTWVPVAEMAEYGVQGAKGDTYFHTAYRPEELAEMARLAGFSHIETGTFEKEVKYATRVPVLFYHVIDRLNRMTVDKASVAQLNRKMLETVSSAIYDLTRAVKLDRFLVSLVKEGVRSYLRANK